jgi:hypothetical protein
MVLNSMLQSFKDSVYDPGVLDHVPSVWGYAPNVWGHNPNNWGHNPNVWGHAPNVWRYSPKCFAVHPEWLSVYASLSSKILLFILHAAWFCILPQQSFPPLTLESLNG